MSTLRQATAQAQVESYIQSIQTMRERESDGAWIGSTEHLEGLQQVLSWEEEAIGALAPVLRDNPSLSARGEALRALALLGRSDTTMSVLDELLEHTGFYPLMGRRLRGLQAMWAENQRDVVDAMKMQYRKVQRFLWFAEPLSCQEALRSCLRAFASYGEPGLYHINQLIGEVLEDASLMSPDALCLVRESALLYDEHRYFEGVEVLLDFLADCRPEKPSAEIQATVGTVLKSIRKLRPYRYPKWATPLRQFVSHYKKIGKVGRAAEANMLIILIAASSPEEALLLDDDELVDLLRGRRDSAYTEEELASVASLCDAVLDAGRVDCRILHIRGWLAARLDGPQAAQGFFHRALASNPNYVYSHLALSSLGEMRGDDSAFLHHLEEACRSEPTLISCHRRLGDVLQQYGRYVEARQVYERGVQVKSEQANMMELEELFGCFLALSQFCEDEGAIQEAVEWVDQALAFPIAERFSTRFLIREHVIIELLQKGMRDLRAEIARHA